MISHEQTQTNVEGPVPGCTMASSSRSLNVGIENKEISNSESPRRVYIYGAGAIACHHAAAATNLANTHIFAADPSPQARANFIARFPKAKVYDDAQTMLSSSVAQDRDIVIIAVPLWLHKSATLAAFATERHVLCEKPAARSITDLKDMLSASHAVRRRFLECSFRYLGNQAMDRARQLIESGGIGTPYHVRLVNRQPRSRPGIEYQPKSKWFLDKEKAGGGAVFDFGVYDFTMLFDVLRPVAVTVHHAWTKIPRTSVDPTIVPISVETHAGATMSLHLKSGNVISLDYERASGFHGEAQEILNVDGSEGGLTWEWVPTFDADLSEEGAKDSFQLVHFVDVDGKVVAKKEKFPAFGWNTANFRPLHSFVDLLEGHETLALSEAQLLFNFEVVSAVYEVAATGKAVSVEQGTF
ncbi:hypothetical protein VTL71DRAFT_2874 [Oculimacula yallundae]|uniref:Gfo/Idh/MocA-like oxidoreductase N-terminal domain-containing protein n=1 Tax=Oculimacula yallundae TaxID=86028 RepID=A0ABR4C5I7_9HELO